MVINQQVGSATFNSDLEKNRKKTEKAGFVLGLIMPFLSVSAFSPSRFSRAE